MSIYDLVPLICFALAVLACWCAGSFGTADTTWHHSSTWCRWCASTRRHKGRAIDSATALNTKDPYEKLRAEFEGEGSQA